MEDTIKESLSHVSLDISIDDMSSADYKKTINELGLALEAENTSLTLKVAKLEERIDKLALEKLINTKLKDRIEYLETCSGKYSVSSSLLFNGASKRDIFTHIQIQ